MLTTAAREAPHNGNPPLFPGKVNGCATDVASKLLAVQMRALTILNSRWDLDKQLHHVCRFLGTPPVLDHAFSRGYWRCC